jgi:hypothetical protein
MFSVLEIKQNFVYINPNVQQLHFFKCFPSHVTDLLFTNFPVYGTYKNAGLHTG